MRSASLGIISATVLLSIGLVPAYGAPASGDGNDGRLAQSITMSDLHNATVDQAVPVDASATSLLPVTIDVSGPCQLQALLGGSVIVSTGKGQCVVTASQDGDDLWLPAEDAVRVFDFIGGMAGAKLASVGPQWPIVAQGLALNLPVRVTADDEDGEHPTGTVTATLVPVEGGPACDTCAQPQPATLDDAGGATITYAGGLTETFPAGSYAVSLRYSGDARYAGVDLWLDNASVVPPGQPVGVLPDGSLPIVVSVGDSYISGEGGRWAGNAINGLAAYRTDVGADTYNDAGDHEAIAGCHRSKISEIHIDQAGANVASVNLACSGAQTATLTSGGQFKPGIDFSQNEGNGQRGQALELYRLASANPGRVSMVVLSIGGNDFHFGGVVQTCVVNFMKGGTECSKLPQVQALFAEPNLSVQLDKITQAILNINDAMSEAGYASDQWSLLVQDYPSPVPEVGSKVRYRETWYRQLVGGCGMYDVDMKYAYDTMLKTINQTVQKATVASGLSNVHFLDLTDAYAGNRLCETGVDLVGPTSKVGNWKEKAAILGSEWISAIRVESLQSLVGTPYQEQESLHPGYWGQLANQVCLKLAFNDGNVQGGTCLNTGGMYKNTDGDQRTYPIMKLQVG